MSPAEAGAQAAATPAVRLARIGQVAVTVRDLGRAVGFYRDTLGMRFLFEVPGMAFFDCGGVRLLLGLPESPEFDSPSSLVYYVVDDIHAAYDALRARGVPFLAPPQLIASLERHDLWLAPFRDSEGNVLELMSEVPRQDG